MKLHPNRFALLAATIATILFVVGNLVARVSLREQVFVPSSPTKATIPQLYFLNYSIVGVMLVFVIVFALAWIFANVYNKFAKSK